MNFKIILGLTIVSTLIFSCAKTNENDKLTVNTELTKSTITDFDYIVEQFADIKVLRYQIHGFDALTLKEQKLVYYLTQAGLSGRDIMWDQNYRHNLTIRKALENVYTTYTGDKTTNDWSNFEEYLKSFVILAILRKYCAILQESCAIFH